MDDNSERNSTNDYNEVDVVYATKYDYILMIIIASSLALHSLSILVAPLRKTISNRWLHLGIWLVYVGAGWAADDALFMIFSGQAGSIELNVHGSTAALWAAFLLVHLGGPDFMTSLSMEDNELWDRHLLTLVVRFFLIIYVMVRSSSTAPPKMTSTTAIILFCGFRKYIERTIAFYSVSLDTLKRRFSQENDKVPMRETYVSMTEAGLPSRLEIAEETDDIWEAQDCRDRFEQEKSAEELLKNAARFFGKFRVLIVDFVVSPEDRQESRSFFTKLTAYDAFKLIELELSMMYEFLFSKTIVSSLLRILLAPSFILTLAAFYLFYFRIYDGNFVDLRFTSALFIGFLGQEIISIFMLMFSDQIKGASEYEFLHPIKYRRWSNSMRQFNLISYCRVHPEWLNSILSVVEAGNLLKKLTIMRLTTSKPVPDDLKTFIFMELRWKALVAPDTKAAIEISSKRGGFVLRHSPDDLYEHLKWSLEDVEYANSLLLWHIATEIRYCREKSPDVECQNAKILSDYSVHLLVSQPAMMFGASGNWQSYFKDTCADAQRLFSESPASDQLKACEKIYEVNTDLDPKTVKGDQSKTVLFDACVLAKQLTTLKVTWKQVCQVWLELLSYAATQCRGGIHAEQVSRGGELLTFIWFLMVHLGLGKQFGKEDDLAGLKLVVGK